jgi:hypothetical protein
MLKLMNELLMEKIEALGKILQQGFKDGKVTEARLNEGLKSRELGTETARAQA